MPEYELISFHIIEKINNSKLITWTYPTAPKELKDVVTTRVLEQDKPLTYTIYRTANNEWVNVWESTNKTKQFALALVTKIFNPYKFRMFGKILTETYERSFNAVDVTAIYLDAFKTGLYTLHENETAIKVSFSKYKKEFLIRALVSMFGVETIFIYNALLLKKRVLVYHFNLATLQKSLISITQLMDWNYRNPNVYLYPLVKDVGNELKGKSFYVAGIDDKSINIKNNFDVLVNLKTGVIDILPKSKEMFGMTKVHKEIAKSMVQFLENDDMESETFLQNLNKKTEDILINLRTLATQTLETKEMITLEELRSRKFTPAMETFLFNLAIAENIMML